MAFPSPSHSAGAEPAPSPAAVTSDVTAPAAAAAPAPTAAAATAGGPTAPAGAAPATGTTTETKTDDESGDDTDSEAASDGRGTEAPAVTTPDLSSTAPDACLVKTICSVKQKIRWQTPAWSPSQCQRIAGAVATSAKRHDLSPTLLLAIMINESDMNEKAVRLYLHGDRIYAKDGGLMAIRCIVDKKDRCINGNVRGMKWKDLMDPVTNIEVGARELAYWRDGGGISRAVTVRRGGDGRVRRVEKDVPCRHTNHAFWAHYNHGPRYIDKGYPRHYPHRIAVLDHALATVMNVDAPELDHHRITIHDPGKRDRSVDRPLEPRFKKLYNQILQSGSCSALALN
jgi:hypothetical protein